MVGITDSLRVTVSGLQLAQRALANTSNNISNVHTEGFTRKTIEQEARVVGGNGAGVRQTGLSREVDSFLEQQLRTQVARLGRSETIQAYLDDVQGLVFGDPGDGANGLTRLVDDLATELGALAARPEDAAARTAVVWSARDLFNELGRAAETVQALRRDADQRIGKLVAEANAAVQTIHELNLDLKRSGNSPDLLDQRDQLVLELGRMLDISTYTHDDGTLAIFTESGEALLEYQPRVLAYTPTGTVGRDTTFGALAIFAEREVDPATLQPLDWSKGKALVGSGVRAELTPELALNPSHEAIEPTNNGGELGGLLAVRDRQLPELDDQLTEFGRLLRHALNAAHNDANALPLGNTLASSRTEAEMDAGLVSFAGSAFLQVTDAGGAATVYEIDVGAASSADDLRAQIAAFDPLNLTATFDADGRLQISVPAGWTIAVANQTADGSEPRGAIVQQDAAGHSWTYSFAHYLGLNDFVVGEELGELDVRSDIVADPMRLATALLDVRDNAGTFEGSLGGVGDNRGFLTLSAALDAPFTTVGRGGLPSAEVSARAYLGDLIGVQALAADTAEQTATGDRVLAEELGFQKAGISGVNLDEEMAHLVALQQAYAASAQLLTAAEEMLDALMSAKR